MLAIYPPLLVRTCTRFMRCAVIAIRKRIPSLMQSVPSKALIVKQQAMTSYLSQRILGRFFLQSHFNGDNSMKSLQNYIDVYTQNGCRLVDMSKSTELS